MLSNQKYSVIDKTGKTVSSFKDDYIDNFSEGLARTSINGKGGYIDTFGNTAILAKYHEALPFYEGLAYVSLNGKWGYADKNGKEIVPLIYDHASPFRGGFGQVMKNGKYGFVDASGSEVVPCIYDDAGTFRNGMVEVDRGGKGGYVDSTGKEVSEINLEGLKPFLEGSAAFIDKNKKFGFWNNPLPTVADVSINISSKSIGDSTLVSLASATENSIIYYTLSGSDPYTTISEYNSILYTGPFKLWSSTTIKAVGVAKGMQESPIAKMGYKQIYLPSKVPSLPNEETKSLPPKNVNPAASTGFVDVNENHWAKNSIKWAVANKVVSGYVDGTFRPDANVSEPEFLAMLLRAYPEITVPVEAASGAQWYNPYYQVAEQNNWSLLHETDGKLFNRGQVALLLAASQGFSFKEMNAAVQYVLDTGIAGGKTSPTVEGFAVEDKLKRSEAITLIHNMKGLSFKLLKADITPDTMEREFKVRGISIGDSEKDVLAQLGEPARKDRSEYGFQWYIYNQDYTKYIQVGIQNGKVVGLYSNVDNWSSNRGVKLGMEENEIIKRYGNGINYIPKDGINFTAPDTKIYLQDGSYTTLFLDKHNNNTVTAIQLIEKSVESGMTNIFAAETQELLNAFERQSLDLVNSIRVRFGLKALEWDNIAAITARNHSEDMRDNHFFDHINLQDKDPFDRMRDAGIQFSAAGENIAGGHRSAIYAHESLMNSAGHRENILSDWDRLGVGVAFNGTEYHFEDRGYNIYYTQNFAKN